MEGEVISISSELLFQRACILYTIEHRLPRKLLSNLFDSDLSANPMALFDEEGQMRKNIKSDLYAFLKNAKLN